MTAATGGSAFRTRLGYRRLDWAFDSFHERKWSGGGQLEVTTFGTPSPTMGTYASLPQTLVYSDGTVNRPDEHPGSQNVTQVASFNFLSSQSNCGIEYAGIILDRRTCVLHWRGLMGAGPWAAEATAMDGSFDPVTFTLPENADGDFKLTYRGSAKSIEEAETHSTLRLRIIKTASTGGQSYVACRVRMIVSATVPASAGAILGSLA